MLSKKDDFPISSVRAWRCVDKINELKQALLRHPYIVAFSHDMTLGKGQLRMLSDDKDWLKYYYTNPLPLFFTDESGRILPEGVYVIHTLPMTEVEKQRYESLKKNFNYAYSLLIIKHEKNIQHTYSFHLNCDENQLIFFLANKLPDIHRFIAAYERQCKNDIDWVKSEKNHLIYPYGGKTDELTALFQRYLTDDKPLDNQEVRIPHALDNELVSLSQQQAWCFQLLLEGKAAKVIAQRMNLSHRTIEHYTAHIYKRLGIHNSGELISHYSYLVQ